MSHYYHARINFGGDRHYWWNRSRASLVVHLLIPFINGQVIAITKDGKKRLFNMKTAELLTVYKTNGRLRRPSPGRRPVEFDDPGFEDNICTEELLNEVRLARAALPTQSLLQKAFALPKRQAFVIMPFGNAVLDSAYEGVIIPLVQECGLLPLRVDEIQNSGSITEQILEGIAESTFIIAELSGQRPNCYYECGFAHALGKELILLVGGSDQVHFDLAGYRFIEWSTESELRKKLRARLQSIGPSQEA